jgi:putative transposase
VLSLQNMPSADRPSTPGLCSNAHDFSLHAAVRWAPISANNRSTCVVLQLKSAYKDDTTHIVMAPLEFMQRLAALVPRPRLDLIRFHGVLAPNASCAVKSLPVR